MMFASPSAAALAAVSLLIVAQYFLKIRRPRRVVPSTLLWQQFTVDSHANSPWQRLRAEPLLLMQLAMLALLVLALMRPYVLRAGDLSTSVVFLIDTSIDSMLVENGRSVLQSEVDRAISEIDNLAPNMQISIVQLDRSPRVLLANGPDYTEAISLLRALRSDYAQPDVAQSIALSEGLYNANRANTSAIIILHASITSVPRTPRSISGRDEAFGATNPRNLGITALSAATLAGNRVQVSYAIANSDKNARQSDLEIYAHNQLQAVTHVLVPASATLSGTVLFAEPGLHSLRAHLSEVDALAADNTGWAVLSRQSRPLVVLAGDHDMFLLAALHASGMDVRYVDAAHYSDAVLPGANAVIFNRYLPDQLPAANILAIDPPRSFLGVTVGTHRRGSDLHQADDPAGLLRYLTMSNIHIRNDFTLGVPAWAHAVADDRAGSVIVAGEAATGPKRALTRIAVLGFTIGETDLPLQLEFPLLISNLLNWLAPSSSIDRIAIHSGDVIHLTVPVGVNSASIVEPNRKLIHLSSVSTGLAVGNMIVADTGQPGLYQLRTYAGGSTATFEFAVNPGLAVSATSTGSSPVSNSISSSHAQHADIPVDLTQYMVVAVLVIVMAEWCIAMRLR